MSINTADLVSGNPVRVYKTFSSVGGDLDGCVTRAEKRAKEWQESFSSFVVVDAKIDHTCSSQHVGGRGDQLFFSLTLTVVGLAVGEAES